jgi:hypothetical protein
LRHTLIPQNFVVLHGMGVGRYMNGRVAGFLIGWKPIAGQATVATRQFHVTQHTHSCVASPLPHSCVAPRPFHVVPKSFAEWACGAIVIAFTNRGFLSASSIPFSVQTTRREL